LHKQWQNNGDESRARCGDKRESGGRVMDERCETFLVEWIQDYTRIPLDGAVYRSLVITVNQIISIAVEDELLQQGKINDLKQENGRLKKILRDIIMRFGRWNNETGGYACYEHPILGEALAALGFEDILIVPELWCDEPAGTWWSPYWCFKHNVERMKRVGKQLEALLKRRGLE
jgi:hypothetical protein